MKIGKKFWCAVIIIVILFSLLPLTSAATQGLNSVRKSGKDYVLCEPGEYCIGMPITRAVIPSDASSSRVVLSFEQPELPVVSRITPEEARKSFERDKQYYGEPGYVSFPYGRLENVSGFEINSRNIESKKYLLTNKSKIHGVLLTNGISIYDGSAYELLKSRGVKIYGPVGWSKDVTVPVEALNDIEKSGYFIWFGLVPKEGKASKKLIENFTANPDKVFSVRIWVYDDVKEQESIPFLEPYIAGPVLPKARLSDGVNYYVNMTGSGVMKILEYDFVYGVVEQPYKRPIPGNFNGMPAVGTDVLYAATTGGLNGSGINISFIDTGVKTSPKHQDLPTPIWQYDYCTPDEIAEDLNGHGTHVTGIALGRGTRDPRFRGVAPGANLMMARWIGCSSRIWSAGQLISDLIANGANIISNSYYSPDLTQVWNNAFYFDRYMYDGAPGPGGSTVFPFIVAITGNNGTTLGEPGFSKNALTVGASKIGNDGYGSYTFPGTFPRPSGCTDKNEPAGEVACFSNYGPTEDSNRVKPDVIAPGYNISSTALSGGYSKMWGTSFSAPYVAGIAALFMENYPVSIDYPEVIKANIINSAIYLDGVPANKQGHGHVNAFNAIYDLAGIFEASSSYGWINGNYNLSSNFTVPSGYKEVKVTLVYIDSEHGFGETNNNLDLEIYDQNGDLIGSSTSANDTVEEVKITGEPSGTWTREIIGADVNELVFFAEVISVRLADPDLSLSAPGTAYASPSSSFLVDTTLNNAGFTTVGSYIKLYLPSGFSINYANVTRADGLVIPVPKKRLYCYLNYCRVSLGETINGHPRKVTWNVTAPSTTGTYTLNFKYGALNTGEQQKSVSVEVSTLPPGTIDTFEDENGLTQSTNGGSWGDWTYYETSSSYDMNVKGSTTYGYGSGAGGKFRIGQGTDPYSDYVEIKRAWPGQPFDTDAGYISVYLKRQNGYSNVKLKLEDTNGYEVRTGWIRPGSTYAEEIIDLTDFEAGNPSTFDWDNVKYITIRAFQRPYYDTLNDLYFDEITYIPSVPSPPTGLGVTDYGTNYITLDWNDNLRPEGVDRYYIYRDGAPTPIGQSTSSDYNDTGLSSGRNYCYKVTAINGEGESDYSTEVCQTTKTPPDSDPPTVSYSPSTPPDGATLSQDYAYIEISASETLNNAYLEWNGANESMAGSGTSWYRNKSAGDGTYSYEVWANDTAGNWGAGETRGVTLDTSPPTGSILINSGDIYTASTSVTLSLNYSADAYKVRYSNDGIWDTELWENSTATKPWTLTSGDGTKTVYYQINDTSGQLSSTYNDSIILDTTPPTTTHDYDGLWHTSDITITLTATDTDGSGVDETYYKINGGPTMTVSANGQPAISTESANNTLEYWSVDVATNEELPHNMLTDIKLDKTAPTTTDNAPSGWQNADVTVTLTPTDTGGSDLADTFYCVDQANTCTPITNGTSVLVSAEGTNYVRYYSVDVADNSEGVKNATVKIDKTPSVIIITSPENINYKTDSVALNYTVNDSSGIDWVGYSLDGQGNVTLTANTTLTNLSDGQHSITVYANDAAGNMGSSTVWFTVDTTLPTNVSSCGTTISSPGTYNINQTLNFSSNNCINIESSDVILDGLGNNINGTNTVFVSAIYVYNSSSPLKNITIKNTNISKSYIGIFFYKTSNSTIQNNTFYQNDVFNAITIQWESKNNTIINNTFIGNVDSIRITRNSENTTIVNNTISEGVGEGIYISSTKNTKIINNILIDSSAWHGIYILNSNYTYIKKNTIKNNSIAGIELSDSGHDVIINNIFNNTLNIKFSNAIYGNTWNTTKQAGTNIVGGTYLGGNFWAEPNGTGFSETCTDADGDGICDSNYTFASGNVDHLPLTFTATPENFNITLNSDWNLVSLPLAPQNSSIDAVLASIDGNYTVVYAWIDGAWKKSTATRNPLTDMTLEYGYWVDVTVPDTLELDGTLPTSTTINVSTGWNLVGYPSLTTRNLTDVLSPINYSVVYAWIDGAWKKSTATRNPLTEMGSGYGYWIDANGAGSYEVLN